MKISALPQLNASCIINKEFCIEKRESEYVLTLYLHVLSLENDIVNFNNAKEMEDFVYGIYIDSELCIDRFYIQKNKSIKNFINNQINKLETFLINKKIKYNKENINKYLKNMIEHEENINFLVNNYTYYIGMQHGL